MQKNSSYTITVLFILAFAGLAVADTWVSQSTSTNFDTFLDGGNTTTNYGSDTSLTVGAFFSVVQRSVLLTTGLQANIGQDQNIVACSVIAYTWSLTFSGDIDLYPLRRLNTVEGEATWNIYSTGNNWGTAGAANTSTDYINTSMSTVNISGTGRTAHAVDTALANAALQGVDTMGVIFRAETENVVVSILSSEAAGNAIAVKFVFEPIPTDLDFRHDPISVGERHNPDTDSETARHRP